MTYEYDGQNRLWRVTDPNQGVTTFTWDPGAIDQLDSIQDPRLITFLTNTYTSGRVTQQVLADPSFAYTFNYTVDGNGKVTECDATDPNAFVRKVLFNADGYMTSDTRAFGKPEERTVTYDVAAGSGLINSVTAPYRTPPPGPPISTTTPWAT